MTPTLVDTSLLDQLALVIAVFVIKPTYMLLALAVGLVLWKKKARDLRLIRWAMLTFFVGEVFCALNYLLAAGRSDALEFGHHAGMIAFGALLSWGLFAWLDDRVLRFSDQTATCAANRFCKHCWKREEVSCGLQRLMLFAAPALALVALIPLSASTMELNLLLPVFGSEVAYQISRDEHWALFRLYPLLACGLMWVTFGVLLRGKRGVGLAQWPFFVGLGFVSFSLLRFFLLFSFRTMPIWSDVWEEVTEFLAILAVILLLWVFRRPLGLHRKRSTDGAA